MPLNAKIILALIVPEYVITLVTFLAVFLLASKQVSLLPLLAVPFVVYLLALFGFNAINQVFDAKMDAITKPKRPIPSKKVTKYEATVFSALLFGLSFILAFFTNLIMPWFLFVIVTFLYSHPRVYLRKYLIATPLFGMLFYAVVPFLFVSAYFGLPINYLFLVFFSLIIACVSILKDIEDIKAEKMFGIKSIPSILGEYLTVQVSVFSLLAIILLFGTIFILGNLLFIWSTIIALVFVFAIGTFVLFRQYFGKVLTSSRILAIFMVVVVVVQLIFGLSVFLI